METHSPHMASSGSVKHGDADKHTCIKCSEGKSIPEMFKQAGYSFIIESNYTGEQVWVTVSSILMHGKHVFKVQWC